MNQRKRILLATSAAPLQPPFSTAADVDHPKISVVMATYNNSKYLPLSTRSILNQTFQDFELILVNDASIDGTAELLGQLNDPRIRIITNPQNLGLTNSLNIAIRHARAEYIARMDADDLSFPHRFEKQTAFLNEHVDHALVGSSYYVIDERGGVISRIDHLERDEQIRDVLQTINQFAHGSVMMRKTVFDRLGGYDESFPFSQDYDLWLRIVEDYKVGNIKEPLYCWRSTKECISIDRHGEQQYYAERAKSNAMKRARKVAAASQQSRQTFSAPTGKSGPSAHATSGHVPVYRAGSLPRKKYELVTVSYFHKRMYLARRMLDTLFDSACPDPTLHVFVIDRCPSIHSMISELIPREGRDVDMCLQTGVLDRNPYCLHTNWVMERLAALDFKHIAFIDSDFELHSEWYRKTMDLASFLTDRRNIRLFTAFNNCNGSGWRHVTKEIHSEKGICYGLKYDCGSGQVLMDRNTFYSLGPMSPEYHDFSWVFRCRELDLLTATTIPSYAQHTGAATSMLSHSERQDGYLDAALDFCADYSIPAYLCGIWKLDALGEDPFYIHPNGLITRKRDMSFTEIMGHVSVGEAGDVDLTFDDCRFSFNVSAENINRRFFLAGQGISACLEKKDPSDCHIIMSYRGFNILKLVNKYYAALCSVDDTRLDETLLNEYVRRRQCVAGDSLKDVKDAIDQCREMPDSELNDGIDHPPKLIEEGLKGFNLVRFKGKTYGLAQLLGPLDLARLSEETLERLRQEGKSFVGQTIEEVKRLIDDANGEVLLGEEKGLPNPMTTVNATSEDRLTADREAVARRDVNATRPGFRQPTLDSPELLPGYLCLGDVLMQAGRFEEAAKSFRRGVELNPHDPDVHNRLGVALSRYGDFNAAEDAFQNVLRKAPDNVDARVHLSDLYLSQGRYREAAEALKKAVFLAPRDTRVLTLVGTLGLRTGYLGATEEALKQILKIDPKHPGAEWLQQALNETSNVGENEV